MWVFNQRVGGRGFLGKIRGNHPKIPVPPWPGESRGFVGDRESGFTYAVQSMAFVLPIEMDMVKN